MTQPVWVLLHQLQKGSCVLRLAAPIRFPTPARVRLKHRLALPMHSLTFPTDSFPSYHIPGLLSGLPGRSIGDRRLNESTANDPELEDHMIGSKNVLPGNGVVRHGTVADAPIVGVILLVALVHYPMLWGCSASVPNK